MLSLKPAPSSARANRRSGTPSVNFVRPCWVGSPAKRSGSQVRPGRRPPLLDRSLVVFQRFAGAIFPPGPRQAGPDRPARWPARTTNGEFWLSRENQRSASVLCPTSILFRAAARLKPLPTAGVAAIARRGGPAAAAQSTAARPLIGYTILPPLRARATQSADGPGERCRFFRGQR